MKAPLATERVSAPAMEPNHESFLARARAAQERIE
jgi:hypothetical protein